MKRMFYTEAAYFIGLVTLALGTALMERADFGMSMVVAPAYLVYLKVSEYLNGFSFGMAEYCFQEFLIIVLAVVLGSFKRRYLFSFITAFIYGNVLDIMMKVVGLVPGTGIYPQDLILISTKQRRNMIAAAALSQLPCRFFLSVSGASKESNWEQFCAR